MNFDIQTWLRHVWMSLIEPVDKAMEVLANRWDVATLWTAMALVAVLNVLLLAAMQLISPIPSALEGQGIALTPFSLTAMIAVFLVFFVFAIQYVGGLLGGQGSLPDTLALMVWFQAVSLTLELGQLVLALFSDYLAAIFGMISLGGLLWCILNFIKVLHGFESFAKSIGVFAMAMIGTGLTAGMLLVLLGIVAPEVPR